LQCADDTIIFMEHDLHKALKYKVNPMHIWAIVWIEN
jgi:hypothetical protein